MLKQADRSLPYFTRSCGRLKNTAGFLLATITWRLLLCREKTEMIRSYIQEVVQYIKRVSVAIYSLLFPFWGGG